MFKSEKSMKNQQKSTNNQKSEKSKNVSKVNCFVNIPQYFLGNIQVIFGNTTCSHIYAILQRLNIRDFLGFLEHFTDEFMMSTQSFVVLVY